MTIVVKHSWHWHTNIFFLSLYRACADSIASKITVFKGVFYYVRYRTEWAYASLYDFETLNQIKRSLVGIPFRQPRSNDECAPNSENVRLSQPSAYLMNAANDSVWVLDSGSESIYSVNLINGERTLVSGNTDDNAENPFSNPRGMIREPNDANDVFVVDGNKILSVDGWAIAPLDGHASL